MSHLVSISGAWENKSQAANIKIMMALSYMEPHISFILLEETLDFLLNLRTNMFVLYAAMEEITEVVF